MMIACRLNDDSMVFGLCPSGDWVLCKLAFEKLFEMPKRKTENYCKQPAKEVFICTIAVIKGPKHIKLTFARYDSI